MGRGFEFKFHEWLQLNVPRKFSAADLTIGIGDDAAVLAVPQLPLVVTTDAICEGVHFDLHSATMKQVGHKALAVNLSDLAAMGAWPLAAIVTLVFNRGTELTAAQELMQGILELADRFEVAIAGGDTNRWGQGLVVNVTALGCCQRPWTISGAEPGDVIVTTGPLGGSIHGHHLDFLPRLDVVQQFRDTDTIKAATDISDSLSVDLDALCSSSGCGAVLFESALPFRDSLRPLSQSAKLHHALTDGEDFELLLAIAPDAWRELKLDLNNDIRNLGLVEIGRFQNDPGIWLEDSHGVRTPIPIQGFEH